MYLCRKITDMKKYISFFIALFMTFGLGACSSDDENITDNEYDELPAWLIPEAQKMAEEFKNFEKVIQPYYIASIALLAFTARQYIGFIESMTPAYIAIFTTEMEIVSPMSMYSEKEKS